MPVTPGSRLAKHEIVASIGEGAMGSACSPRRARTRETLITADLAQAVAR
jgi:hypothetical protein